MALALADAIVEVRYQLNETTAAYWTDAEITDYIQEGCRVFSSKSLLVEADDDITLVADQLLYVSGDESWIADCLEIHSVYYNDQSNNYKGLIKVQPKQLGHLDTFDAGDPKYYCLFNRSIYVWPLTTAAIVTAGGVVTVLYATETDDITDIHDEFQHLPIMYAVAKARFKEKDFGGYTQMMTQFYTEVGSERSDKWVREIDTTADFQVPKNRQPQGQR